MRGYVKLYRKTMESSVWTDPDLFRLWMYCLMKANHEVKTFYHDKQQISLEAGQFVTGRFSLEKDLNNGVPKRKQIPETTLWNWLKKLQDAGNIDIKSTNKYSIVTVVNWSEYQESGQQIDSNLPTDGQQTDNRLPTDGQQVVTNKNVKNLKNDKNVKKKVDKLTFLEFVKLTKEEHEKLAKELGESRRDYLIDNLNNYIGSTGKKYKSHYHTILVWSKKDSNKTSDKKGASKYGQNGTSFAGNSRKSLSEQANERSRRNAQQQNGEGDYRCNKCKDIQTLLVFNAVYEAERPKPEDDPLNEMERFSLDRANEVAVQCSCVEERKRERLMNNSRITPEFQSKSFANFSTEGKHSLIKDMKDIALAYYKNFDAIRDTRKNSIAFYGQPGSGKTHLLSALCNSFIKKKLLKVVYFPYIEGFNDLKDNFEALNAKLEKMNTADVLFIDDLFKGNLTDWEFKQIMAVVNYRYLNNLPLLISTEHDVDSLCAIDEAFGSRIYEMTKDYAVTVKGDKWELNYRLSN